MTRDVFQVLRDCAREIGEAVLRDRGRGLSGLRDTQYHVDVIADEVARRVLSGAGLRVVSEESGVTGHGDLTVVVDPIDGSTNCDHGVPFYATSLAVLRAEELVAGLVLHHGAGTTYEAEKGAGATRDGTPIKSSGERSLANALMSFSGLPGRHLGWAQFRSLGAASLEICLVADGSLDAYAVAQHSTLQPWDYLAGLLVCLEAGAFAGDYRDDALETSSMSPRRPYFAASSELLEALRGAGPV